MRTSAETRKEIRKIKKIDRDFPSNDWCEDVIEALEWALGKSWPEGHPAAGEYPRG